MAGQVILLHVTPRAEELIARVARVSRGVLPWEEEEAVDVQRLLRFLKREGHLSPFEFGWMVLGFAGFTRACLDQMRTHRHLSFLAESTRHVRMSGRIGEFFHNLDLEKLPAPVRAELPWIGSLADGMVRLYESIQAYYGLDVARALLPLGIRYNWVAAGNLRAWWEFCGKRLRGEAHEEIRELARQVAEIGYRHASPVLFSDLVEG